MRILRVIGWVLGIAVALAALAALAVLGGLYLTLPASHAEQQIAGLAGPVDIAIDTDGIPHIRAGSDTDAAAALGFVHARDRMFSMDLMRRNASGRLSEIAGTATLPLDRMMRVLDLRGAAARELAALPPGPRAMLDAYARGVSAWIAAHGRASAPQYLVLGAPEPWTPVDSLLWGKLMGLYLSGNWRTELARAGLAGQVPRERIDQLWPAQLGVPSPAASAGTTRYAGLAARLDAILPRFPDPFTLPDTASNEWAVDGRHSVTGAPLLAGDPHLGYSTPGIWYLARIDTPSGTLAGATSPGVPFLVIGRNSHIAWTFTTTGADTQDLFEESVLPEGGYQAPGGPEPFRLRQERIGVLFHDDETLTVRRTRHGPVISDLVNPGGPVYAASIASLQPGDGAAEGLFALNKAETVAEAGEAAGLITSPVQNLLVADGKGIGQFTTGRVPVRRAGDGAWPQAGADGAHDWIGWASGAELPHVVDPASGRIVNANERVAPPGFPVFLGRDWFGDWRARRIRSLLGDGKLGVLDFAAMQTDVTSSFAQSLLGTLRAVHGRGEVSARAVALLKDWDGSMTMDAPQPLIFNAWMQRFGQDVVAHAGIPANATRPWAEFVAWVLSPAGSAWCDGDCTPFLVTALQSAMEPLAAAYGADPAEWRWGTVHIANFADPILAPLSARIAQPGDDTTIFRGGSRAGSFEAVHGPSYRGIYDLATLDRSLFMVAPGQSGHPLSRHVQDMLQRWRDGAGIALTAAIPRVEATIKLVP